MRYPHAKVLTIAGFVFVAATVFLIAGTGHTHCDTLDGPVVNEARTALSAGDVTPVLKWVRSEDEPAIREAFDLALAVRGESEQAQQLADRYFFDTLVRIHRAGEGSPFDGLKPAGLPIDPGIELAEHSLADHNVDALVTQVTGAVEQGIRQRYQQVVERQAHVRDSVDEGREYVEAYVTFVHYVEGLHRAIETGGHAHAQADAGAESPASHEH